MTAYDIIKRPIITEQSMADTEMKQLHLRGGQVRQQDRDRQGGGGDLRREGRQGQHPEHAGQG